MQTIPFLKYKAKKESNIDLMKKGNKEAFIKVIKQHELTLYRVAKGILKLEEDTEDAIQNTIIKAYEKISTLKNDEYFKTWLIRILINESNLIIRKNKKLVPIEEIETEKYHIDSYENIDITRAIEGLSENLRIVTLLFYYEDISIKDIAKILGIPEGTVRSRLTRARKELYEIMREDGEVEL
ncbi:RNA polymerase sigma factor [Clostridium paridis]|uniref:Sigma-70 family RNA polymerase sigma factor n=1 Tax=Clostridium paridis TaxID=2803863 RepID=A0A937K3E7_9CLOT|nr:sigma-70 family RNA polymerase sigma factor [Clostridium paridis]MBL4931572.1 sigma-70 family RNA polymerase sigma factor [Clostridium paridis]